MNRFQRFAAVALLLITPSMVSAGIVNGIAFATSRARLHAATTGFNGAPPGTTVDREIVRPAQGEGPAGKVVASDYPPQFYPSVAVGGDAPAARAGASAIQQASVEWGLAQSAGNEWGTLAGDSIVRASAFGHQIDSVQIVTADSFADSLIAFHNMIEFDAEMSIRVIYGTSTNDSVASVNGIPLNSSGTLELTTNSLILDLAFGVRAGSLQRFTNVDGHIVLTPIEGTGLDSARVAMIWGAGVIPGANTATPLIPHRLEAVDDEDEPANEPVEVSGTFLTLPVVGTYGYDDFVYVDPEIATGYRYEAQGANFASFVVPFAMPGGDSTFELVFGSYRQTLHSGQEFNFTDFVDGGVSEFRLLGIDRGENIDPTGLPPFISGYKFTHEGAVTVTQWALADQIADQNTGVPEPTSIAIFGVAFAGLFGSLRRRKSAAS